MPTEWPLKAEIPSINQVSEPKKPRQHSFVSLDTQCSITSAVSVETPWTVSDMTKAGTILNQTPESTRNMEYESEEEMRRVYSLIYDAFRYRSVLNEALNDVHFYILNSQCAPHERVTILLFYDLYKRRFLPRDNRVEELRRELFLNAGIPPVDEVLWSCRVRLAAALARIRIRNNALHLSKLLPKHLKDDRVVSVEDAFATGWVNSFKSKENIIDVIENAGLKAVRKGQEHMEAYNYQFDPVCPKFILCHPEQRTSLLQSELVKNQSIVLQDRAFCLGPAVLSRILLDYELTGYIVQTHITTPRSVAYLANVLADNDKIDKLLAFGAADRREEYECYLKHLGVTNARIFSERFVDIPSDSHLLEGVVGVLATPPNTFSGVNDPVDLVCSRGGDMTMLEVLTDVAGNTGCADRVGEMLEEQRQTLRHSMSKPQTQVVVYVTHSVLPDENGEMVRLLVKEMNSIAHDRHAEEQGVRLQQSQHSRLDAEAASKAGPDAVAPPPPPERKMQHRATSSNINVKIPLCDLFEVGEIPNICLNSDSKMEDEGCFLSLLQRKEIVRLDSMYMINIAESRGLFGDQGGTPPKKSRSHKKRAEMAAARSSSRPTTGKKPRGKKLELDRITAPTVASLLRQVRGKSCSVADDSCSGTVNSCQRHQHHNQEYEGQKEPSNSVQIRQPDYSHTSTKSIVGESGVTALLNDALKNSSKETLTESHQDVVDDRNKRTHRCSENNSEKDSSKIIGGNRVLSAEGQAALIRRLTQPTRASMMRNMGRTIRGFDETQYSHSTKTYVMDYRHNCHRTGHRLCSHIDEADESAHPNTPSSQLASSLSDDFKLIFEEDELFLLTDLS